MSTRARKFDPCPAALRGLIVAMLLVLVACAGEDESATAPPPLEADEHAGLNPDGIEMAGDLEDDAPLYRLTGSIDPESGQVEGTLEATLPAAGEPTAGFRYFPALVDPEATVTDVTVQGSPAEFDLDESLLTVELGDGHDDRVEVEASFGYEIPPVPETGAGGLPGGEGGLQPADVGLLGRRDGMVMLGHWYPVWMPDGLDAAPTPDGFGDISNFPAAVIEAEVTEPEGWTLATGGVTSDSDGRRRLEAGHGLRDLAMVLMRGAATTEATTSDDTTVRVMAAEDRGTHHEVADEAVASLETLSEAFGSYPWTELDVVATPLGSGVGGMEFPGMIWIEEDIFAGRIPGLGDPGDIGDIGDIEDLEDVLGGDLDLGALEDRLEDLDIQGRPGGDGRAGEQGTSGDPGPDEGADDPDRDSQDPDLEADHADLLDTLLEILLGDGAGVGSLQLGDPRRQPDGGEDTGEEDTEDAEDTDGSDTEEPGAGSPDLEELDLDDMLDDLDLGAALDPDVLGSIRPWVVAHEVGHQWWHAIVGNDSLTAPIVDEPLAQHSACVVFHDAWPDTAEKACDGNTAEQYRQMRLMGDEDAPADQPTDQFDSSLQYGGVVYGKAPHLYTALSDAFGEEAILDALADVVSEHAFGQVSSEDLRRSLGESLGDTAAVDLLWSRWIEGTYGDEDLLDS